MKSALALVPRDVTVGNVGEVVDFTIKANGKAFKVLIDRLYSDKVLAVVRELCSNAFDSHAAAGNPAPFDLHLPMSWAPHFSVRDYGTSLDHNGVMKLYTTVFESSKEDTNTQVGQFGLGSKSPFAYTDTFTVTAWKDGMKRSYSAYLGKTHVPQIAFMGEEPSDEPTGFEVSFPVETDDIHLFMAAAQKFILGLDQKPNMIGGNNPGIKSLAECKVQFAGPGWWVFNDRSVTQTYARQGCVLYPIDRSSIESFFGHPVPGIGVGMIVDFPIGELDMAASREALSYDEMTCGNIAKRITPIIADLGQKLRAEVIAAPTYLEATRLWSELRDNYSLPDAIRNEATRNVRWRGRLVGRTVGLPTTAIYYGFKRGDFSLMTASWHTVIARRKGLSWNRMASADIVPGTVIYVQDMDKGDETSAKPKVLTLPERRIRAYHQHTHSQKPILWIKTRMSSRAWKVIKAYLAGATFVTVNGLPLPISASLGMTASARRPVQVKVYAGRHVAKGTYFEETTIDATQGGYYVDLERDEVRHGTRLFSHSALHTILSDARKLGLIDAATPIYGIPKSLSKLLNKSNAWVNILDVVKRAAEDAYAAINIDTLTWQRHDAWGSIRTDNAGHFQIAMNVIDDGLTLKPGRFANFVRFVNAMRTAHKMCESAATLLNLLERLDVKVSVTRDDKVAHYEALSERFVQAANKRYPLIPHVLSKYATVNDEKMKAVIDYVNLVDA